MSDGHSDTFGSNRSGSGSGTFRRVGARPMGRAETRERNGSHRTRALVQAPRNQGIRATIGALADVALVLALLCLALLFAGCGGSVARAARPVATAVVKAACVVCETGTRLLEGKPDAELAELESCTPELAEELEGVAAELRELEPPN